ncbi:hypothetical protein [Nocardia vaccinii]|uniref:hypothetical protein n=1 Tax=Nocardia vaccinii TaxID=1822 RepID=UPI001FE1A5C1|nr:hypothetical protein [Nocardia vaccinii]
MDVTALFNGLQPILQQADPAIYNRLTHSLLALLQGDNDAGVGPILDDIATLASYAGDRAAVFRIILDNLHRTAGVLSGNAQTLATGLQLFSRMFTTLTDQVQKLLGMINQGAAEFSGLDTLLSTLQVLVLGGSDKLNERLYQILPDPAQAVQALTAVPAFLQGLSRALPNTAADLRCSKGNTSLPGLANILLSGRQVVLCTP